MSNVIKIVCIYVAALMFSIISCQAKAYVDYDVDWPPSNEKGIHTLRITIDGCSTIFKIKDKDFYDAVANEEAMMDSVKKAIARAAKGCK
jgi:hypothetical protein